MNTRMLLLVIAALAVFLAVRMLRSDAASASASTGVHTPGTPVDAAAQHADAPAVPRLRERPALEAAIHDPFAAQAPRPAPVAALRVPTPPAPPPTTAAAPLPPPAPSPPALRIVGSVHVAGGESLLLASAPNGEVFSLEPGRLLADGWRVGRIDASGVELLPADGTPAQRIAVPPPPRHEVR